MSPRLHTLGKAIESEMQWKSILQSEADGNLVSTMNIIDTD